MNSHPIIQNDLQNIFGSTISIWEELRGQNLFLTGGTGFFGTWLLESFAYANKILNLNASVLVLTRNYDAFRAKNPHLTTNPAIKFHIGDIKNFVYPAGNFKFIIHGAATSANETFNQADILEKFDTVTLGTRHLLDFAVHAGTKKILYTSSGVAYGKQPPNMTHIPESYVGAPETTNIETLSAWGNSKRTAEFLCAYYSNHYNIEVKFARCFSFVGPFLPLGIHYAIGNFIQNCINGQPIKILGDGTPRRSYLYTSDLTVWLWTILFNGAPNYIYNVGSEHDISILDLAKLISSKFKYKTNIEVAQPAKPNTFPDSYIPSTLRARTELSLKETVPLAEAIEKTIGYYSS